MLGAPRAVPLASLRTIRTHGVGQQESPDPSAVEAPRAKVDRSTLATSGFGILEPSVLTSPAVPLCVRGQSTPNPRGCQERTQPLMRCTRSRKPGSAPASGLQAVAHARCRTLSAPRGRLGWLSVLLRTVSGHAASQRHKRRHPCRVPSSAPTGVSHKKHKNVGRI